MRFVSVHMFRDANGVAMMHPASTMDEKVYALELEPYLTLITMLNSGNPPLVASEPTDFIKYARIVTRPRLLLVEASMFRANNPQLIVEDL